MEELKISMHGHVKITSSKGNQILLDEHNEIGVSALEILLRCSSQVDFPKSIDTIRAYGQFGYIDRQVFQVSYAALRNTQTFRATFLEFDFDGVITKLELRCSALDKVLAIKNGVNISKDAQSRAQIDWAITVTN